MILSTISQLQLLIYNILAGVLTGILFDIYRSIRGAYNNKIVVFIQDILFWILASIIVFIFLFIMDYAYIGIYCYIYIGVGLFLYLKLISKYFLFIINKIGRCIGKIIRVFINIILYFLENLIYVFIKKEKKYKNNLNKK